MRLSNFIVESFTVAESIKETSNEPSLKKSRPISEELTPQENNIEQKTTGRRDFIITAAIT
jgi:hypothetical protein